MAAAARAAAAGAPSTGDAALLADCGAVAADSGAGGYAGANQDGGEGGREGGDARGVAPPAFDSARYRDGESRAAGGFWGGALSAAALLSAGAAAGGAGAGGAGAGAGGGAFCFASL